jgi:putative FmdB family regulatory protein
MPTYRYRCADCSAEFEQYQKFTDAALTTCPTCHGAIRRVIGPVGVVFKGSGFYINDSRKSESGPSTSAKKTEKSDSAEAPAAQSSGDDKGDKSAKTEKVEAKESVGAAKASSAVASTA